MRIFTLLAAASLLMVPALAGSAVAQPTASAQSDDEPGSIDFEVDDDGFNYVVRPGGARGQVVNGSFDLDSARLNVSYNSSDDPDAARSVSGSFVLSGVYEFRDVNGNNRFDLGDEVVDFHPVKKDRSAGVEEIETDGPVRAARATYPLDGGGEMQFTTHVSPQLAFLEDGRPVQPTDTELNVTLEGVDTVADDSELGVAMRLESEEIDQTGAREIRVGGDRADAVYSWPATATVDGETAHVRSSVLEQRVERDGKLVSQAIVIQAVDPGERIHTLSTIDIDHTEPPATQQVFTRIVGDPLLFAGGLIAALLVVGGNAWAKLRSGGSEKLRDT